MNRWTDALGDRRVRTAAILGLAATVALVLAALAAGGHGVEWGSGLLRVRVHGWVRPFVAALIAGIVALALAPRHRIVWRVAAVWGVVALAVGLLAWVRTAPYPPFSSAGDIAMLETYTLHATDGRALLGPYSRFGWNHPGPLLFYLLAPGYALSGYRTTALYVGSAVLNVAALALVTWAVARFARPAFAIACAATAALFMFRIQESIASAWTPHVLVLPMMALVVIGAAVAIGRIRWIVPLAIVASFLVQTHVGAVPTVAAIVLVAVTAGLVWPPPDEPRDWRLIRRVLNATAWTLAALWLLPVAQELSSHPGNLSALWHFFTTADDSPHHLRPSVRLWADLLTGVVRPGFEVAWGNRVRVSPDTMAVRVAAMELVLLVLATIGARTERRTFHRRFGVLLIVACVVSCVSVTRIRGELLHYVIFWVSGLGALVAAFGASFLVEVATARLPRLPARVVGPICAALFAVALVPVQFQLRRQISHPERPDINERTAWVLFDDLTTYRETHGLSGKPLIRMDVQSWSAGAGIVVQLQKRGEPFAVERNSVSMFSTAAAATGEETWELIVAGEHRGAELRADPATEIISDYGGVTLVVNRAPPGTP